VHSKGPGSEVCPGAAAAVSICSFVMKSMDAKDGPVRKDLEGSLDY
jgi:hypothetical protein